MGRNRHSSRRGVRGRVTALTALTALLVTAAFIGLAPAGADDELATGEDPPAEELPADDPPADDPPADDPPADDPPADDPPAEDPPAEDPPADDPPSEDDPLVALPNESDFGALTHVDGSVTVRKTTDPAGGGPFPITLQRCTLFIVVCLSWSDVGTANLSDGVGHTFDGLTISHGGTRYRLVENVPTGWRLVDVTCDGSSFGVPLVGAQTGVQFQLTPTSDTRDCTFDNSSNRITVTKVTDPAGAPTEFEIQFEECTVNLLFACTGDWITTDFTLTDGGSQTFGELDDSLFHRLYRVREESVPPGWNLVGIECTGTRVFVDNQGDQSLVKFDPLHRNDPANATCVVTNELTDPASITVEKTVVGDDADFVFDLNGVESPPIGNEGSHTYETLFPGEAYTLTEQLQDGYLLTDRVCELEAGGGNANIEPDAGGNAVTITPEPNQEYHCTYTNEQDVPAAVVEEVEEVAGIAVEAPADAAPEVRTEGALAFTGSSPFRLVLAGLALFGAGTLLVLTVRRRRRSGLTGLA